jgi:hypothetical protein
MCTHVIYNGNILSHSKCGTKYLDKVFGISWEKSGKDNINSQSELLNTDLNLKYVIVRDPKEHFLSAMDTLLSNDKIYIKSIHKVHDDYIYNAMRILYNNMDQHWCPYYYENIYSLSKIKKIIIIYLNDLTDFVEFELKLPKLKYNIIYGDRTQTFDEIEKICKETNFELWNMIEEVLINELYFYNKLVNENSIFDKKIGKKLI